MKGDVIDACDGDGCCDFTSTVGLRLARIRLALPGVTVSDHVRVLGPSLQAHLHGPCQNDCSNRPLDQGDSNEIAFNGDGRNFTLHFDVVSNGSLLVDPA